LWYFGIRGIAIFLLPLLLVVLPLLLLLLLLLLLRGGYAPHKT